VSNRPRPKTRPKTRHPRTPNRNTLRAIRGWLTAGQLESALAWTIHEATRAQIDDIAARSLAITESVAALHGITDDLGRLAISERITGALTVDTANEVQLGDESGAELAALLAKLNSELARKPRPVTR